MFFETEELNLLSVQQASKFEDVINQINNLMFEDSKYLIKELKDNAPELEERFVRLSDDVVNEYFIFKSLITFYECYSLLWQSIYDGRFSESWKLLQDCLDMLRVIKKFCNSPTHPNIRFFEAQLVEIEKLFPHKYYCSPGMIIERFRCSICSEDIDGPDCPHLVGELYRGQIAQGVANNIKSVDHVALVENPADKRCVFQYEDNSGFFRFVRYMSELLKLGSLAPNSAFTSVFTKQRKKSIYFVKQQRNSKCKCGSGKKFKKCCAKNEFVEQDHFSLICGKKFKQLAW